MCRTPPRLSSRTAHLIRWSGSGLLALLLAIPCSSAWATGDAVAAPATRFSIQGFGTLGLARTNNDSAEFARDLSQPDGAGTTWTGKVDSLLGIQANLQVSPQTEGVLQLVSRHHYDASFNPELTWAFLRHDVSPDVSVRAGRLGTEFYMLGDSRLVGYSNLSLRPPPDFYGSLVFSYIDGLDVSAVWQLPHGLLRGKVFAGKSPEKTPYASGIVWDQRGSTLQGGYLEYQTGPWQARASHARVRFNHEAPTDALLRAMGDPLGGLPYLALVPAMAMQDKWTRFASVGLVYDAGPLNVQLMLNQVQHDGAAYADSKAAYALAAYRLGAITPYAGISRSFTPTEPLPASGSAMVDVLTASLVSQSYVDQNTITLGARWDFQKNMALKAQIDRIDGQPTSKFLVKNPQPGWDGRMTVFSLSLDFVF
jgi:hypothetical protein